MLFNTLVLIAATTLLEPADKQYDVDVRESIVYSTVGDTELLLDAFLPDRIEPSPAILVVHGGAWRMGNREQLRGYANSLARMGVACFAIDYRLAPDHKFPAQIEDCRSAVKWIRENANAYRVDATRQSSPSCHTSIPARRENCWVISPNKTMKSGNW